MPYLPVHAHHHYDVPRPRPRPRPLPRHVADPCLAHAVRLLVGAAPHAAQLLAGAVPLAPHHLVVDVPHVALLLVDTGDPHAEQKS